MFDAGNVHDIRRIGRDWYASGPGMFDGHKHSAVKRRNLWLLLLSIVTTGHLR